jgi:catechol 2,3-dioxygenase-like lactoylglutathione lyase family enzyme
MRDHLSSHLILTARAREKMTVELNHTIILAKDKWRSAKFLADILGLEAGPEWSHFVPVRTSNGVTLDFADATEFRRQHYAFLVSEPEFDAALSRIKRAGIAFYADFNRAGHGEINHLYGGRGLYFDDPDGHLLEIITRPYGPSPERWTDPPS